MNPWRGLKNLPREIWILCAATLVNRSGTMVLSFLVLYITATLGVSPARAALALTVYGVAALLAMPFAGRLADRVGPLPIMKASLFLTGALLLLFPLAKNYAAILGMTFGFAVLNESVRPANLSMVSSMVAPAQRKAAFALNRLAANLGMSVGPAVGGILAVYSFRWLFLVDGATSVLAGAVLAVTPMAQASPPDQTWLAGLYDNADYDSAVLAVTATVASLDYRPWPGIPATHTVVARVPQADESLSAPPSFSSNQTRAPPGF